MRKNLNPTAGIWAKINAAIQSGKIQPRTTSLSREEADKIAESFAKDFGLKHPIRASSGAKQHH